MKYLSKAMSVDSLYTLVSMTMNKSVNSFYASKYIIYRNMYNYCADL